MNGHCLYQSKVHVGGLSPGQMQEHHFWLLVEISPIHSEKVINALRDFLVLGYTRREACERHEVSQGYFSGALRRFQMINQAVIKLIPFYIQKELHSKTVVQ
ncbi:MULTISPECIES: adhesin biosynthesis transcription regulatory family protein [Escherichia]|uniref:adhesin biosynthesis transcription regulatory family protein n=1 Tax=Escherichia TaxID=561 RepID=UPI000248258D|nr:MULTISPECIES: adhesin biosynthesis transcription regulatory family protein [Escherichia]